jgi:hypothetical protein
VLTSAVGNGSSLTVQGTFNSTANHNFRLEFFANGGFLGATNVSTDGTGNAPPFTFVFGGFIPNGVQITATATDLATSDTSEFSAAAVFVTGNPPPPPPPVVVAAPPLFAAFLVKPPGKGQVAVQGFVLDPNNQLPAVPLVIVIDWGDGTKTFTGLFSAPGGFQFFLPQSHKKRHKNIIVHLESLAPASLFADVLPPFIVPIT